MTWTLVIILLGWGAGAQSQAPPSLSTMKIGPYFKQDDCQIAAAAMSRMLALGGDAKAARPEMHTACVPSGESQ